MRLQEVEALVRQLTPDEQLQLLSRIAQNIHRTYPVSKPFRSLRDAFRSERTDAITPEQVDESLREIRSEWLKELDGIESGTIE